MNKATQSQLSYFYRLTRDQHLKEERSTLCLGFSDGRTENEKDLFVHEMQELIAELVDGGESEKQRKKILSHAHQLGWAVGERVDFEKIEGWMLKYSYLHKKLNEYTLEELPKLVTQFEKMVNSQLSRR